MHSTLNVISLFFVCNDVPESESRLYSFVELIIHVYYANKAFIALMLEELLRIDCMQQVEQGGALCLKCLKSGLLRFFMRSETIPRTMVNVRSKPRSACKNVSGQDWGH